LPIPQAGLHYAVTATKTTEESKGTLQAGLKPVTLLHSFRDWLTVLETQKLSTNPLSLCTCNLTSQLKAVPLQIQRLNDLEPLQEAFVLSRVPFRNLSKLVMLQSGDVLFTMNGAQIHMQICACP
jgi:hypothetical protein